MKATELMIGDYVQFKGCSTRPLKINGIVFNNEVTKKHLLNVVFCDTGKEQFNYNPEMFEGIKLTREILEKNGVDDEHSYFKEDNLMLLEITYDGGKVHWTINCNEYYILPLNYVHELQHALRLCGIEKEIVL